MKLHWQISAGEFFELLRPAALLLSAILSTWVLASSRRWNFRFLFGLIWAITTFFVPFIVLPLYLIARSSAKRRARGSETEIRKDPSESTGSPVRFLKFVIPSAYCAVLLSLTGFYFYRDRNGVDAHLARAAQAKVMNQRERAIKEYRAALALEDSPHTHKLLGIELADAGLWPEALLEFRAAERGAESDESLSFRAGQALDATGNHAEAAVEYQRFLSGAACTQPVPDSRCEAARARMHSAPTQK